MPSRNWAAAYEIEMDQHTQLLTHTHESRKHAPHDALLNEGGQVHPVIKMDVDTVELCSGLASINTQVYLHKTGHDLQIVLVTTAQRVNHSDAPLRSG